MKRIGSKRGPPKNIVSPTPATNEHVAVFASWVTLVLRVFRAETRVQDSRLVHQVLIPLSPNADLASAMTYLAGKRLRFTVLCFARELGPGWLLLCEVPCVY